METYSFDHILIRYGELCLKKANRKNFLFKVTSHIKSALKSFPNCTFENRGMRYYVKLNGEDANKVLDRLAKIPGIYSFSLVTRCGLDMEDIKKLSYLVLKDEDLTNKTIKIETHRGNKSYPLTSLDISKQVAGYLFKNIPGLKADMRNPDITLNVEVRDEGTFIYTKIIPGMGGLPYGSLGKGLLMISGGIDSVVAGYLSIKKGMEIDCIHYASPPYTSDNSLQKVVDLLEVLAPYTTNGHINLYVVPFTNIQQHIYDDTQNDYCITIMRRMMYRIAERIANKKKDIVILNGESVGQVASQTLDSISVINETIKMPVIRPLATYDKLDVIKIAEKIGSYEISIRPYDDCCTVFVPKHPQIKPKLNECYEQEEKFDWKTLVEEAVEKTYCIGISSMKHTSVFKDDNFDDLL